MTYKSYVAMLAKEFELPKRRVDRLLMRVFGELRTVVKAAGRAAIPGFGVFLKTQRKARTIRVPPTSKFDIGERPLMALAPQTSVSFRPARNFKEQVKP